MVEESDLRTVLQMVWNATLRLPVNRWDASIIQPDIRSMLAGYVSITGDWSGYVGIHAHWPVARQAASIMFDIREDAVTNADVNDAFGELANQIGGKLEGLLPEPCAISLPVVLDGSAFLQQIPCAELLFQVTAESGGYPLMVTLVESLPSRQSLRHRFYSVTDAVP